MARFSVARANFAPLGADEIDDGTGLPKPINVKAALRREAGIREAKGILEHLPRDGESLHAICTARMDLTDIINAMIETIGPCSSMKIATLGYNQRNLTRMLAWLDGGQVKELTLMASQFFRSHQGDLWELTQGEFRQRKQRTACCHSHAKVVAMVMENGQHYAIEGSANLCGNGSGREQIAIVADAGLYGWHAQWIDEMVGRSL